DSRDYLDGLDGGVKGLRIAFAPTLAKAPVDDEVAALVAAAAKSFGDLGASVEEATPDLPDSAETFACHWLAGAATLLRAFSAEQRRQIDPGLVEIAEQGAALPLLDYLAAIKEREAMGVTMNLFHRRWELLLMPTIPIPAFAVGRELPVGHSGKRW